MHTLLITIVVTITTTVVLVIVLDGCSIGKDADNNTNEIGMAMIVCAKSLTPQHLATSGMPPQEAPVVIAEKRKLFFSPL